LQSFTAYERISTKMSHDEDYFVPNKKSVKLLIHNSLALRKEELGKKMTPKVEILYALTPLNILLLEVDNPIFSDIIQEQIMLVEEERVELSYLFVVIDKTFIKNNVLQKLKSLSEHIPLKIVENSRPHYEEIIYPHNEPFMLYQTFNDVGNYVHISKHSNERMDISREYHVLYNDALSLDEYISQLYPLNGKWYGYSFGSTTDNQSYHTIKIEINNNTIIGEFPSGVYRGTIQECKEYTLLLFDHSIIKIQNSIICNTIFHVSIIDKEQNIHHRDVLMFGLMSRKKLKKEDISRLLNF